MPDELVLVIDGTPAHPYVDTTFTQVVQQRELHGQANRMVERHLNDRETDSNPRGLHRKRRREEHRIVVDALAGEVVLGQPNVVKTELLREAYLLNLLIETLGILVGMRGKRQG